MSFIFDVLQQSWALARQAGPYLLAGFVLAGIIHAFVPVRHLARWLGGGGWRSVFNAAAIGVPLPLCSCSVVPVAAALRRGGASRGATSAFLISTPESGVDSIAATWALLDPLMTVARPVSAFLTAFSAGIAQNLWGEPRPRTDAGGGQACGGAASRLHAACCATGAGGVVSLTVASPPPPATATPDCCSGGGSTEAARADRAPRAGLAARLAGGLHYGLVQMFEDLGRYMLIGFLLAGLLAVVLEQWQPLGDALHSPWAPFVMLVVGVPVYVCAASMTPMVAVLISQGLSPGAGLVFLLVGPATNAASLVLLKQILGLRAVVIYLASIVVCALLAGYAVDGLYGLLALQPRTAVSLHHHGHEHMGWLNTAAALVLALLVVNGIARRYAKRWWGGASPSQPEVELSGRGAPGRA